MRFGGSRRLARGLWLGAAVGVAGAALGLSPWMLELEENAGLGWLFAQRGPIHAPVEVAIVGISRDSAEALGVSPELDEWPRALHAELIDRLNAAGAAIIVFDIFFHEPRTPAGDERLATAVAAAGNVILLERVQSDSLALPGPGRLSAVIERRHPPIERLKDGALASAPFTLPVVPIRTNQFWTFGRAAGDTPTLPVVALQAYLIREYGELVALLHELRPELAARLPRSAAEALRSRALEEVVRALRGAFAAHPALSGQLERALERNGTTERMRALLDLYTRADFRYLSYYGPAGTVSTLPYHRVLELPESKEPSAELAGKVVFVGYSESRQPEQQDAFISVFSERTGRNLSGVEIGATAFANMLERRWVSPLPMALNAVLVALFGLLAGVSLAALPAGLATAAALAGAGVYSGSALWLFKSTGVWLPLIVPVLVQLPVALLGAVLWNYRHMRMQRERIEAAFGYYLPAREVRRFAEQHVDAGTSGELQHGTCLLTDVERYTAVSERMHPAALRELLNRYYAVMLEAVERHGGLVTDFAGDSMVAVWATEQPDEQNTRNACAAALAIVDAVREFNRRRDGVELATAIGLDTGLVLLGNVGAGRRFEYRAVGDIVTTSSRLQGLNRVLGTRILASGATLMALDSDVGVRGLGRFLLRGKTEAVSVGELLDPARPLDEKLLAEFEEALGLFMRGEWRAAQSLFESLVVRYPQDGPCRFYAALSEQHAAVPPQGGPGAVRVDAR